MITRAWLGEINFLNRVINVEIFARPPKWPILTLMKKIVLGGLNKKKRNIDNYFPENPNLT